ncbi:MAG TPA: SDR family oxidoreductase [Solirubrobacteraceae bacterium]|nr:SDR family oxidoreductase [Solirubrobacteraceae bacterium]
MDRMQGRIAVVTGGASGIGRAISLAFAREGARVAVLDLRADAASAVAAEAGADAHGYGCDVADPEAVGRAFAAVAGELGAVDVLVNNAGIAVRRQDVQDRAVANIEAMMTGGEQVSLRATSTLDDETWDRTLRVHLYGTFHCSREALRVMEQRGSGVICNMSSVLGVWGSPAAPEYGAAKGGIAAFTKGLALEVLHAGIRVNAIAPGYVRTPMTQEQIDPRLTAMMVPGVLGGDMTEPETIAALAVHLCSDESAYTTGQVISPNGGLYV